MTKFSNKIVVICEIERSETVVLYIPRSSFVKCITILLELNNY